MTALWRAAVNQTSAAEFTYLLPPVIINCCFVSTCAAGIPYVARSQLGGRRDMASLLRIAVTGCSVPALGAVLPPKVHSTKMPCLRMFGTHQALWSQAAPKPGKWLLQIIPCLKIPADMLAQKNLKKETLKSCQWLAVQFYASFQGFITKVFVFILSAVDPSTLQR